MKKLYAVAVAICLMLTGWVLYKYYYKTRSPKSRLQVYPPARHLVLSGNEILVTMNGKPIITAEDFNQKIKDLSFILGESDVNTFSAHRIVNREILEPFLIERWIEQNGLRNQKEYLDNAKQWETSVNWIFFVRQSPPVSDEEILAEYEKIKSEGNHQTFDETAEFLKKSIEF